MLLSIIYKDLLWSNHKKIEAHIKRDEKYNEPFWRLTWQKYKHFKFTCLLPWQIGFVFFVFGFGFFFYFKDIISPVLKDTRVRLFFATSIQRVKASKSLLKWRAVGSDLSFQMLQFMARLKRGKQHGTDGGGDSWTQATQEQCLLHDGWNHARECSPHDTSAGSVVLTAAALTSRTEPGTWCRKQGWKPISQNATGGARISFFPFWSYTYTFVVQRMNSEVRQNCIWALAVPLSGLSWVSDPKRLKEEWCLPYWVTERIQIVHIRPL